jgi:hypothetical protein
MKFLLVFSICSAVTAYCNNPMKIETQYNSWSECVGAGGLLIKDFSVELEDKINKDKLYMNYFCNEVVAKGTPS